MPVLTVVDELYRLLTSLPVQPERGISVAAGYLLQQTLSIGP